MSSSSRLRASKRKLNPSDSVSSSSSLFKIDESILQVILEDYLTLEDISVLDEAILNRVDRPQFLSLLPNCLIGRNNSNSYWYVVNDGCLKWLTTRGLIKLSNVQFNLETVILLLYYHLDYESIRRFSYNLSEQKYRTYEPDFSRVVKMLCNLEEFSVYDRGRTATVSDSTIEAMAMSCPKLRKVRCALHGSQPTEKALMLLTECNQSLKELEIFTNHEMGPTLLPNILPHCQNLETLLIKDIDWPDIPGSSVTDEALSIIPIYCPNLKKFDCSSRCSAARLISLFLGCQQLTSFAIKVEFGELDEDGEPMDPPGEMASAMYALAAHCPHLESVYLNMSNVLDMSDAIVHLAKSCSLLRHVALKQLSMTEESLIEFSRACPQLRSLSLERFKVLDKSIISITENCPQLSKLSFCYCSLSKEAYKAIATQCVQLEEFRYFLPQEDRPSISLKNMNEVWAIFGCHWPLLEVFDGNGLRIKDVCISNIARYCPKLRKLKLYHCSSLTTESVSALAQYCTTLHHLRFIGLAIKSYEALVTVFKRNPRLKYLPGNYVVNYGSNPLSQELVAKIKEVIRNRRRRRVLS